MCVLAACGDDGGGTVCGVAAGTPAGALTLVAAPTTQPVSIVDFIWGVNNDCTPTGASVISVTIRGQQMGGGESGVGFCLPRPDQIGSAPVSLRDTTLVQLVGASYVEGDCVVSPAADALPSGTLTFTGFCTEAGTRFQIALAGQIAASRDCGAAPTSTTMMLGGTALVTPQP